MPAVDERGLWQTWLAFLPTVILAVAGLWWLARETGRADADAAAVAARALSGAVVLPAPEGGLVLGGEAEARFVYADPPVPRDGAAGLPPELLTLLGEPSDAPADELLDVAVDQWPSVLTPVVLRRAEEAGLDVAPWRRRWETDEVVRGVLRRERDRLRALEGFRWFATPTGAILFHNDGTKIAWWTSATIEDAARAAAAAVQARVPEYLAPGVTVAGEVVVHREAGKVMARAADEAMVVEVALVDRGALLASVRRQLWLPGGVVVAAFFVGLTGFVQSRRAMRREIALNRAKSDFVSSVSHELRAPVASVRLLAERMADGKVVDPEQLGTYARFIRNETRRLGALIENVLDVSRIEQGRKDYEFEEADVAALVRDAIDLMAPAAAEKRVRMEPVVPRGETAATIDPLAVRQAMVNLIDNAIKHAPSGSAVRVSLEAGERAIALSVEDSGPGIAPDEQGKIFDRFYRIGSEINRESPGAGIGLSLVAHTARAHGGRVQVRSAPGQGALFILTLPSNGGATGGPAPAST